MEQKDHFVGIELVRIRYVLLSITLLLAMRCLCRLSSRCAAIFLPTCCNTNTEKDVDMHGQCTCSFAT